MRAFRRGLVGAISTVVSLGVLVGCAPPLDGSRPTFPFGQSWSGDLAAPRLMDDKAWWQGFNDPILNALIERGLQGSPSLAAAQARAEAANQIASGGTDAYSVSGGISAEVNGGSLSSQTNESSADMTVGLLFDPGRGREAEQWAKSAEAAITKAELAGAQLFLIGEISDAYLALRHGQRRLQIANADRKRMRETLALAKEMMDAGEGTIIEATRSEARLASLEAGLPGLEGAIQKSLVRIAVLTGAQPGQLPPNLAAALAEGKGQPRAKMAPDPGLPADLLRNRPDLQVAEARYDVARANLGQVRAARYPRLSLSGTIEAQRTVTSSTVTEGSLSSFGPSLRLPSLPTKSVEAGTKAAEKEAFAAHADWTAQVLSSLGEVESALIDYRSSSRSETASERAVGLNRKARELISKAVLAGELTLSDQMSADEALASAELAHSDAILARARAFVQLNLRLGSGL